VQVSISPNRPESAGKTVAALAAASGADPIDQLCEHLIADNGATRVLITSISEDDIRTIVRDPNALVGSDGNCVATYGTVSQGMPHPRFYGTFPRIIGRYVGEEHLLPLEAAVHKMTGATASALKLRDRGCSRRAGAPTSRSSIPAISATSPPTPTRTDIRAARAPRSSSTASWSSIAPRIPAPRRASCCAARRVGAWGNGHPIAACTRLLMRSSRAECHGSGWTKLVR
jgi:hypothetical protein